MNKRWSRKPLVMATSKYLNYPVRYRRGTSDLNVFDQIFVEREYNCLDSVGNLDLIIDCGANVGFSSAYFLSQHPNASIIAIEPDPDNFALLERNVAPYGSRVNCIRAAIWPTCTQVRLTASTTRPGDEWGRQVEADAAGDIQAIDIPTLLAKSGADRISLLKIDIEGAEAELFASGTEAWLPNVDTLVIEIHGQHCGEIVHSAIAGEGFNVTSCGELTVCRRS